MKYLIFFLIIIFSISKEFSQKSCGISSIYKPNGSLSPVVVYSAKLQKNEYKFTVLLPEHLSLFKIENESVIYLDKQTGEKWYSKNHKINDQLAKITLNLCKNLHLDNKTTKIYMNSKYYARYKSDRPNNIVNRIKKTMEKNTSFLQTGNFANREEESNDELKLDRLNLEVQEELEESIKTSKKSNGYAELNNQVNLDKMKGNSYKNDINEESNENIFG